MARRWNDPPDVPLLPEAAGAQPDAPEEPTDAGRLVEEPGCPVIISGGRRMTAPPGPADRCAVKVSSGEGGAERWHRARI